jgi:hypothetical protein
MAKPGTGFNGLANRLIESAVPKAGHELDTEDLEQAPHFVLQIDALAQQRLAGREQCAGVVALDALHMHPAVPPGTQDLRYPARVVPISLVAHGGKGGLLIASLGRLPTTDQRTCQSGAPSLVSQTTTAKRRLDQPSRQSGQ